MDDANPIDFDPRNWLAQASLPTPGPVPKERDPRRWPWLAGSALCFAGSLAAAWAGRERERVGMTQRIVMTGEAPARPEVPVRADGVERTSALADAGQLAPALAGNGVAPDAVAGISRAAMPHLAGAAPITLTLLLRPGTPPAPLRVTALHADSSGVVVTPDGAGNWHADAIARAVETRLVGGSAQITGDSLYTAAIAAGLDEALLPDFAKAFAYDFDFQTEVGAGDTFEMEAEQGVNAQGRPVGAPRLVFAQLSTQAKSLTVYRFAPAGGEPGWFDANGRSVVRSFMRTPVDGARVSSQFGVRMHPVLDQMKMHEGVDFAVPLGTPIYAAANGTVLTARLSATAGNMVELGHEKGAMTRYFHMTRFAEGIAPGVAVHQGQVIGLSGSTGRSTGPHLHYELRLAGKAVDPLTYQTDGGHGLADADLAAFRRERDRIDAARAHQGA